MTSDTTPQPRHNGLVAAVTLVVVASTAVAGVNMAAVGIASAEPTGIDSCTTIDESGVYELTANVTNESAVGCIEIAADDVTLDGNGYAVDVGDAANATGIVVGPNESGGVENVTVRDVTVRVGDGGIGVAYRNVTDGVVENVTADAGRPLRVVGGEGVTVRGSAFASEDAAGVFVTADDATVVRNEVNATSTTNREDNDTISALYVGGSNGTVRDNAVHVTALEFSYDDYDYGVRVGGSDHVVAGNDMSGDVETGVVLEGSDNSLVGSDLSNALEVAGSNNTVSGVRSTATGVRSTASVRVTGTDTLVEDTRLTDTGDGIVVTGSGVVITNVTLTDTRGRPIEVDGSNNTVTDVESSNSDWGIVIRGSNNTVTDTAVDQTINFGFSVAGSNNTVSGVTATRSTDGVVVDGSNNTLLDSTARENSYTGIAVRGSNGTVRGNDVSRTTDPLSGTSISVSGTNNTVVENEVRGDVRGIEVTGPDQTVRSNRIRNASDAGVYVEGNRSLVYDNLIETAAGGERVVAVDRSAIVRGRGPGQGEVEGIRVYHSNAWNVTARSDENVVGGSTTGGNYYAVVDGTGFSEACRDADRNGVCDDPNVLSPNDTDYLPLADDTNASVGYLEVTDVDAPPRFERGEAETIAANVTNVGTETVTQSVTVTSSDRYTTVESSPANRTVTLAPGETTTVTFDVVVQTNTDLFLSLAPISVSSANASLTSRVRIVESQPSAYYQVDFAAGQPIENLSADNLYAGQDRLFRFAFGNTDEGITDRGSAWAAETLRECVDYGHIAERDNGTAQVTFTVNDSCGDATLTLAVYSLPGETFEFETAAQQELLDSTTRTFGPGEHTITVDLPDSDEEDDA